MIGRAGIIILLSVGVFPCAAAFNAAASAQHRSSRISSSAFASRAHRFGRQSFSLAVSMTSSGQSAALEEARLNLLSFEATEYKAPFWARNKVCVRLSHTRFLSLSLSRASSLSLSLALSLALSFSLYLFTYIHTQLEVWYRY